MEAALEVVSVDQRLEKLEQQVAKLAKRHEDHTEIADELKHAWREFRNSNASRRGLDGGRGEIGPAGRDAVIRIVKADNKIQVIDVNSNATVAEISVPAVSKQQLVEALADAIKDEVVLRPIVDAATRLWHQQEAEAWEKVKQEVDAAQ